MIIHLKQHVSNQDAANFADRIKAFHIVYNGTNVLITGASVTELPELVASETEDFWVFKNDMQLSSKTYLSNSRDY
jgi:hypothetical protein